MKPNTTACFNEYAELSYYILFKVLPICPFSQRSAFESTRRKFQVLCRKIKVIPLDIMYKNALSSMAQVFKKKVLRGPPALLQQRVKRRR